MIRVTELEESLWALEIEDGKVLKFMIFELFDSLIDELIKSPVTW